MMNLPSAASAWSSWSVLCPRCGIPLEPVTRGLEFLSGLGWCVACGETRSVEAAA